jgi:mannan endo-1,4-beta-mannosidase
MGIVSVRCQGMLLIFFTMLSLKAMRGTTVRGHTLGISVGNPLSVEPSLDVFNEAAYESIDFAILAARIYGIKVN